MPEDEKKTTTTNSSNTMKDAEHKADTAAKALDAKLSGPLAPLEKTLDGIFGAKAPFLLPKNIKELLVTYAPWLSLISGILGLLSALGLWNAAHRVNSFIDYSNRISALYGGPTADKLGLTFWVSIIVMVLFAVLALLAFPGLKAHKKNRLELDVLQYARKRCLRYRLIVL